MTNQKPSKTAKNEDKIVYAAWNCKCGFTAYMATQKDVYKHIDSHFPQSVKGEYKSETPEHFVTVIGCFATDDVNKNWFTKKSYKEAVKYAKTWWKEAFELGKGDKINK